MTKEKTTVQELLGNETIRDLAQDTDKAIWAGVVGLHITAKSKAADIGFDFGAELAKFEIDSLVQLRWELRDEFLDAHRAGSPEKADDPIYSLIRDMVDIIEAELGGRWIR